MHIIVIVSVPQQTEKSTDATSGVVSDVCASTNQEITGRIKELEIFGLEGNGPTFDKDSTSKLDNSYMRLAAVILSHFVFHVLLRLLGCACSAVRFVM